MAAGQIPESINFPDPFWFEHGEQIRRVRKVIETPKTRVGEEILRDTLDDRLFVIYNRLHPIFSSLLTLVEYDEIGRAKGESYFSEPTSQRIVLKALKILIEDKIKFPYREEEILKYEDYDQFFKKALFRLGQLEKQIQTGQGFSNFVNSLLMIFSQETGKLEAVKTFSIKTETIRKAIADYLPQLAQIENGELLSEIQAQLEMPLVSTRSIRM